MSKGILTLTILTLTSTVAFAGPKTICGPSDDRVLSYESEVGRLFTGDKHGGCTATMISDTCAITAGHCGSVLDKVEFNTPISRGGVPYPSKPEDIYDVDKSSIVLKNGGPGRDWAVFKVKANNLTGKLAGEAQGYLEVSFSTPSIGDQLKITGYGLDRDEDDKNLAQQTNSGALDSFSTWNRSAMNHTVDTMGGNSGSSIIQTSTGKIVGIHTHGGCTSSGGANTGTSVALNYQLKDAILKCLGKRW